jgi:hypothetical protein
MSEEFNLQQWASKEKYFAIKTKEHFSGLVQGRIQGFNKALDLVMEEFSRGMLDMPEETPEGVMDYVVSKLKGEK